MVPQTQMLCSTWNLQSNLFFEGKERAVCVCGGEGGVGSPIEIAVDLNSWHAEQTSTRQLWRLSGRGGGRCRLMTPPNI